MGTALMADMAGSDPPTSLTQINSLMADEITTRPANVSHSFALHQIAPH